MQQGLPPPPGSQTARQGGVNPSAIPAFVEKKSHRCALWASVAFASDEMLPAKTFHQKKILHTPSPQKKRPKDPLRIKKRAIKGH
jgi:hypothetical protein